MTYQDDKDAYRKEHRLIFGHDPVPDLLTGRQCGHPVHDFIGGMMDMPGVDVEIPFDAHEVRTEDDPEVQKFQEIYDEETEKWRWIIQEVDEREEYDRRRKS